MKIIICGLGAIGSNLLMQLIKNFPNEEYVGIDFDKVEERNINTQAYLIPHIGLPKSKAMNVLLNLKSRKIKYKGIIKKINYTEYFSEELKIDNNDLIIDCFDNAESRKIITKLDNNKFNIIHLGFSPQYTAEIIWNENYSVPGDIPEHQNDICEMSDAVPFINFVVSLGCFIISNFIINKTKKNYLILDKINIRSL